MPLELVTRQQKINQDVVNTLKHYLAMAERGDLICVAIAGVMPDGSGVHEASASDEQVTLLGAVTRLLHRMQINANIATEEVKT